MRANNCKRFLLSYCLVLTAPVLCWPQQKSEPVSVRRAGQGLIVTVNQPSSVAVVLLGFCQQLELQCEVPSVPETQVPVAPMIIRGAWTHVLTKLFEGTELNFAAFPMPNRKEPGRIIVQVRSRGSAPSQPITTMAVAGDDSGNVTYPVPQPVAAEAQEHGEPAIADEDHRTATTGNNFTSPVASGSPSGFTMTTGGVAAPGVPFPGIPISDSAQGLPLPGAPAARSEDRTPLPGIPTSSTGVLGPPLP